MSSVPNGYILIDVFQCLCPNLDSYSFFDDLLPGAEFLFIPEPPVSPQLVFPLGTSGLSSWCSWEIYTLTPS